MIDVKIIKKPKNSTASGDNGIASNSYTPKGAVKNATYANTAAFAEKAANADDALHAVNADNAANAKEALHAVEADHSKKAFDLDPDSPARRYFVSRINDDTVEGVLRFLKGLMAGDYQAGVSGGFFGLDKDGDSFAEVAKLYVRVKAFFESLTIIDAKVLAGKQYITPGGGIKCTKVEETDTSYKCYFLTEQDGEKTDTRFIVGDQAIAEFFNAKTGTANKVSNHRYWRLVTAVDNDAYTDGNGNHYGYIELSKTECESGSDVPLEGDEICQLGYQGDDKTRQTAMVFSTVDADAPSVKLFSGIDSFSLEDKAVISFGIDPTTGKIYFRLGRSSDSHYLDYDQNGGLTIKGNLDVQSTIGSVPVGDIKDGVKDTDVWFIQTSSPTVAPDLPLIDNKGNVLSNKGWSTESPEWKEGKYIWQVTLVVKVGGAAYFTGLTCIQGAKGKDGASVAITANEVRYSTVHTASQPADSTFTLTAVPTLNDGDYLWSRTTVTYNNGQSTTSYAVSRVGANGSDGASYAPNLLKESNVVLDANTYGLGGYEWAEHPADGTECTITVCAKVGSKDDYLEIYQNKGYHKIGRFSDTTETIRSYKFNVSSVAGRTTLVDFYRNPNDGDPDTGTYVKWAVVTLGDTPQTGWCPAASEMKGAVLYSLMPSVDCVSRDAMGKLSVASVTATKYVTKAEVMKTTTEHYLYYRTEGESGTSAWALGAGPGSATTVPVQITDTMTAVVFELRGSDGMVLDRERVPVISDAAGIDIGGTNLLRNTDFIDGLEHWLNNFPKGTNAVTIPDIKAEVGVYDNRYSAKVSYPTGTLTWRKLYQNLPIGRIVPGKTYTLSGFVYIPDKSAMGAAANGSTAYRLRASMCYKLKNDTSNHDDSVIDLMQAPEGEWSYMSGRWTAPANLSTEEKVEMTFYLVANGEYYVNGWKLEEGNVPTAWNAAPEDVSYLRSALRESTSIDGGLIMATLLQLGITEGNEFKVAAGMNGSTDVRGEESIAFWAGGEAVDAKSAEEDKTPAKVVIRHNGTAYFCGNTVRLDASRMEIGREGSNQLVVLDEDGLKLIDGNEQRLRVVNQSVGTLASVVQSTGVTLNAIDDIRVRRTRNKEVTTISNSGTTRVVGSFTKNFNIGSGNLPVGATVNITGSIYSEFPLINDDLEGFPLLGANARLQIYERQSGTIIFDKKATLGYDGDKWKDHSAKISANVTIPKAGEYRGNLMLEGDGTEGPTYEMTVATATAKVEGNVQLGFADQTVLGNDGLLTKWGDAALLVNANGPHLKAGNCELLVTASGIYKRINGTQTAL